MALVGFDHRSADVLRDRPGTADAVIYLVARRSGLSLVTVRIPALAAFRRCTGSCAASSPLTAVGLLNADLSLTLGLGVLVAIPTIVVAGPLFGKLADRWVVVGAPTRSTRTR
jgi:GntP family gluconate:H+ symporter